MKKSLFYKIIAVLGCVVLALVSIGAIDAGTCLKSEFERELREAEQMNCRILKSHLICLTDIMLPAQQLRPFYLGSLRQYFFIGSFVVKSCIIYSSLFSHSPPGSFS